MPYSPVTIDGRGDLYGTTYYGGNAGNVYKLTRTNGDWTFATIYSFNGPNDAAVPSAGVIIGPNGSLYGTGTVGGTHGDGAVFKLQPPAHFTRC